jgi:phosphonate transport system substrate-binding protein
MNGWLYGADCRYHAVVGFIYQWTDPPLWGMSRWMLDTKYKAADPTMHLALAPAACRSASLLPRLAGLCAPACLPVLLCLAMLGPPASARADTPPLKFGVLNQQSPIQTAERWNPILRYLTGKTGIPLQLVMGPTVEATDTLMGQEAFDLIYTNHNFQTEYDGKYRVMARWAGKPVHGVIAVPEDSPLRALQDLAGQVVAIPSADAFLAYAVPMVALKQAGIAVNIRYAGNQEGAMAQLKAGQVAAAALNSRFLAAYAQREALRYRLLYQSEPYQEMPVLIHPRVPALQADALRQALLGMATDPAAAPALAAARTAGFEPARETDYDNVRRTYKAIGK